MTKHELVKLLEPLDDDGNTLGMTNDIGYETNGCKW